MKQIIILKFVILLAIVFSFFWSCIRENSIVLDDKEELIVINSTFLKAIDTSYSKFPPLPRRNINNGNITRSESINTNKQVTNIRLILYVNDTLKSMQMLNVQRVTYSLEKKILETKLHDSIFFIMYDKLFDYFLPYKKIILDSITNTGKFELIPTYLRDDLNGEYRVIGEINYSRVIFNRERTKACYYFSFICGIGCGHGYTLFLEKKNNKWEIITESPEWQF
ncbi:MAG TPA: hypothetical protein VHI78_08515 [Bacteroidales bacterium]|nr:hypothetical protein [Bacteroidales bacterium]